MYFDLQGMFISIVTYWLRLIPIDVYIKKITFCSITKLLYPQEYPEQPYHTNSVLSNFNSLLSTDLKQSNILTRIQITDILSVAS